MPRLYKLLTSFLLALTLTGCASTIQPAAPAVQHIVVVWLKEPGNELHRQQLLSASQQLTQIPGVLSVSGGSVIPSQRPVVDSSFDIALVMAMQNRDVLKSYSQHPLHKELLDHVFKPLIEHYRVYDVELPSTEQ